MDISKLSLEELRELQQKIPQEMKRREVEEKNNVLNEMRSLAKARGYSLEELMGKEAKGPKAAAGTVKVKYRHPENSELQWTGRGRKPKWVEAWLANGGSMENLAI